MFLKLIVSPCATRFGTLIDCGASSRGQWCYQWFSSEVSFSVAQTFWNKSKQKNETNYFIQIALWICSFNWFSSISHPTKCFHTLSLQFTTDSIRKTFLDLQNASNEIFWFSWTKTSVFARSKFRKRAVKKCLFSSKYAWFSVFVRSCTLYFSSAFIVILQSLTHFFL